MDIYEQLLAIPKVELHLHLDGSVDPATIVDLAQKEGIALPAPGLDELCHYLQVPEDCHSLGEYLARFEYPLAVMQTYEALERVAYEICAREAQENVRYFEVRFAPHLHTRKGLTLEQIVQAVLDGLNEGQIEFNIKASLILCAMRHLPPEKNLEIVELAAHFKDKGVVAIDLAGDEAGYPVEMHSEVFQRAQTYGLNITIHAGEAAGADSVARAIELGAERIGHGVRAMEDPALLEIIKERGIFLEMCPKSNRHTKVIKDLHQHPLKIYFDQGLRVGINTDNRTVSRTSLIDEYGLVMEALSVTMEDIKQMNLYAAEAAFLPPREKSELIKEIKAGLK